MIHETLHILKKRFLAEFLLFWIIIVLAALFTFSQKPLFRASAGIMLSDEGLKENTFKIFNENLIQITARKLDLITDESSERDRSVVIEFLTSSLDAALDDSLPVLKVFGIADNPEDAARIADAHAAVLINEYASDRKLKNLLPASLPVKHYYPHIVNYFIIAVCSALVISIFFGFILEYLDTSLGSFSEVETYLKIPVLASIPHIERRRQSISQHVQNIFIRRKRDILGEQRSRMLFFQPLQSPMSESYQHLIHNMELQAAKQGSTVLFVSSENREGKSITAANTAITAAFGGIKTLLIDGDFRYATQHFWFGLPQSPGFGDVLLHQTHIDAAIHNGNACRCTTTESKNNLLKAGLNNLFIMTSGLPAAHPASLFQRNRIIPVFKYLKQKFNLIIIDSSAVMHFNEVFHIGRLADKKIFVYRAGRLSRGLLRQAVSDMRNAAGTIAGLVINDV